MASRWQWFPAVLPAVLLVPCGDKSHCAGPGVGFSNNTGDRQLSWNNIELKELPSLTLWLSYLLNWE